MFIFLVIFSNNIINYIQEICFKYFLNKKTENIVDIFDDKKINCQEHDEEMLALIGFYHICVLNDDKEGEIFLLNSKKS